MENAIAPLTFVLPHLDGYLLAYMLTFVRAGAMIMLLPVFGDSYVPQRVRLALALAVSAALAPVVAKFYPRETPAPLELFVWIAREATMGLFIGAMARIIMSTLQTAGQLIATQIGLSAAQSFDPSVGEQNVTIGTFLSLLGSVLIFESGLHHLLIAAIAGSYNMFPPNAPLPTGDMVELVVQLTANSFALGLQLAAPFLIFGLLVYVALGVLSRLMPQLQVFFLAMPINIMVGFVLLMLFLGTMMTAFLDFFGREMAIFVGGV
jgi:flagellar biosynthetic protein FliR